LSTEYELDQLMALEDERQRRLRALYDEKVRREAQGSLLSFVQYLMPHPDHDGDARFSLYTPEKHHRMIAARLEAVAAGKIKRLIINAPPRHGKSELATKKFPAWYLGKHPRRSVIVGTYNDTFAADLGRAVRDAFNHPNYTKVFPKSELKDSVQGVLYQETAGGGVLAAAGRGSSITGRGGDLIIIDDPIKDRKEADSETIRNQLWFWFTQVIRSRMMTDAGAIVLIQTRWHADDLVGRLTDPNNDYYDASEAKTWEVVDLPALAEENDVLRRKPGEALWPSRFSKKHLESERALDPRGFSALYQGRPALGAEAFFVAEDIKTYDRRSDAPRDLRYYIASDHAISEKQNRDKTCIIVGGVDKDGVLWIVDVFWKQIPSHVQVETMLHFMKRYRPTFWWTEKTHINMVLGPFLRKRMAETGTYSMVVELSVQKGDKQSRAQSIKARMAMGMVRFPRTASWFYDAKRELLSFPYGQHDDFVDALALLGIGMDQYTKPKAPQKEATAGARVGTLAWVKEASRQRQRQLTLGKTTAGW
jgi:predicted phage terminase large subunit-like protein